MLLSFDFFVFVIYCIVHGKITKRFGVFCLIFLQFYQWQLVCFYSKKVAFLFATCIGSFCNTLKFSSCCKVFFSNLSETNILLLCTDFFPLLNCLYLFGAYFKLSFLIRLNFLKI